jgi:hypothetical protein
MARLVGSASRLASQERAEPSLVFELARWASRAELGSLHERAAASQAEPSSAQLVSTPNDDCLKKGAPHCFEISPFFLSSLFLSLSAGVGKKGHFEGALHGKRNGPRALLLIRGSKVAPRRVRRSP